MYKDSFFKPIIFANIKYKYMYNESIIISKKIIYELQDKFDYLLSIGEEENANRVYDEMVDEINYLSEIKREQENEERKIKLEIQSKELKTLLCEKEELENN